jgi:CRISPR-associated protein Csd1
MFLQRLVEYAKQQATLPPPLYALTRIGWLIDLDIHGVPQGMVSVHETSSKGRSEPLLKAAPSLGNLRTSKVAPLLLCDNGGYVLGKVPQDKKPDRVRQQHEDFKKLIYECAQQLPLSEVQAVRRFYEQHFDQLPIPADYDPSENVTFRVNGVWLIDLPAVQQYWRGYAVQEHNLEGAPRQCLVCGETKPAARVHLVAIKGIPGGQSSGMSLISVNEEAYESYGQEQGFVAPICLDCSEQAAKALDYLIRNDQTHLTIGGLVYCFWTREPQAFDPVRFLSQPDPADVKRLIESVYTGAQTVVQEPDFYAVALSANSSRVVVRNYLEMTLSQVQGNLVQWFEYQKLLPHLQGEDKPLGVFALARSLFRETKDIPDRVPETLIRCALTGAPLPLALLELAVRRNRLEQRVPYERAKLIKLVLSSHKSTLKEAMTMLNREWNDPAYKCGRLLAVIERIQSAAIGNPNATLTDKYYGSASTTPASVFGVLLRQTQAHLSKLRKQSEGLAIWLEREMMNAMPERLPKTLNLEAQGTFALGYYHQRSEFFKPKPESEEGETNDYN